MQQICIKRIRCLQHFLISGSWILIKNHVEYCKETNKRVSVDGFFEYIDKSNNPKIKLLQVAVFSHTLGYFILKAGIRQCNFSYFHCGKQLVMPVFFANNHPQYRKLNLYFDFDMALMPEYMYRGTPQ